MSIIPRKRVKEEESPDEPAAKAREAREELERLQHLAEKLSETAGIPVTISPHWYNDKITPNLYVIEIPGDRFPALPFKAAKTYLEGIRTGAAATRRSYRVIEKGQNEFIKDLLLDDLCPTLVTEGHLREDGLRIHLNGNKRQTLVIHTRTFEDTSKEKSLRIDEEIKRLATFFTCPVIERLNTYYNFARKSR